MDEGLRREGGVERWGFLVGRGGSGGGRGVERGRK